MSSRNTTEETIATIDRDWALTDKYGHRRGYRVVIRKAVYEAAQLGWDVEPGIWFDLVLQGRRENKVTRKWEDYQANTVIRGLYATEAEARMAADIKEKAALKRFEKQAVR